MSRFPWNQVQAVFCDMDGTLIDTDRLWHEATDAAFARFGLPLSREAFAETYGMDNVTGVRYLLDRIPSPRPTVEAVVRAIEEETEEAYRKGVRPLPGAEALLETFRSRGYRLALVSTSSPILIQLAVEGLRWDRFFDLRLSSEEVGPGKPDPAVYREAARRLNVAPAEGVALEDTVFGAQSAAGAGLAVIGVAWDSERAQALRPWTVWQAPSLDAIRWDVTHAGVSEPA